MKVGGQAVVEGVMMRNKDRFAVAVRAQDKKIKILRKKNTKYPKFFSYFFIRGIIGLFFTLYDGIKALIWSSNQQLEKDDKITTKEIILTIAFSLIFTVIIFVAIPFFSARWIQSDGFWFDVLDGVFRLALFIIYLSVISLMKDVKTLFQYHGAEHKVINCYESKQKLNVVNAKHCSRFNPRCGTSFVLLVMLIAIVLFTLIPGGLVAKLLGRILLIPIIAGIAYELVKLSDKYCNNILVRIVVAPGLWLQRITTKEPDEKQLMVAIRSLEAVIED
ncbi:MAG: DUF1385 domain-containing protein [archaeon]|nr:DUF1385 domain-containing protein [Nanoarchaeota archaeon]